MITSPHNEKLKLVRRLRSRQTRTREGLFVAEGEDLVAAAAAARAEPVALLHAGEDVAPELLAAVSALGSGTRVLGIYRQRWSEPHGSLSVYLHGVGDPGNIGAAIRSAHALADGPVVLGPGGADPYAPKAVRASMGAILARPPARGELPSRPGTPPRSGGLGCATWAGRPSSPRSCAASATCRPGSAARSARPPTGHAPTSRRPSRRGGRRSRPPSWSGASKQTPSTSRCRASR